MRRHRSAFTLFELLVIIAIAAILFALLLPAIMKVRTASNRIKCANNLHQIGIALHGYHDATNKFPVGLWNLRASGKQGATTDPYPFNHKYDWLSWLALITPYLEQDNIWRQTESMEIPGSQPAPATRYYSNLGFQAEMDTFYPWDRSPQGVQRYFGLATAIPTYSCAEDARPKSSMVHGLNVAFTSYLGVSGVDSFCDWSVNGPPPERFADAYKTVSALHPAKSLGGLHGSNKFDWTLMNREEPVSFRGLRIGDVVDGTSNTLFVGERPPSDKLTLGWWFAGAGASGMGDGDVVLGTNDLNLQIDPAPEIAACPKGPYQYGPGSINNECDQFHFWSMHAGGANWLYMDASVHFLSYTVSPTDIIPKMATYNGGEVFTAP